MDRPPAGTLPLQGWEESVLRHILRAEPDAALATQLAGARVVSRGWVGPAWCIRLVAPSGAFPASRGAVFGGHTFGRIEGCDARAAFTLHLDDRGWVSHCLAFLEDDSPWPRDPSGLAPRPVLQVWSEGRRAD